MPKSLPFVMTIMSLISSWGICCQQNGVRSIFLGYDPIYGFSVQSPGGWHWDEKAYSLPSPKAVFYPNIKKDSQSVCMYIATDLSDYQDSAFDRKALCGESAAGVKAIKNYGRIYIKNRDTICVYLVALAHHHVKIIAAIQERWFVVRFVLQGKSEKKAGAHFNAFKELVRSYNKYGSVMMDIN